MNIDGIKISSAEGKQYKNNWFDYLCNRLNRNGNYQNVHLIDLYKVSELDNDFIRGNFISGHFNPMTYNYVSGIIEKEINTYIYENHTKFKTIPYA